MTTLDSLLFLPWMVKIGGVLIHFLWQGAAIALVLAVVLRFMRRRTPQGRWLVSCLALAALAELQVAAPRLAAAASGGPLLGRVRRVMGLPDPVRPSAATSAAAIVLVAAILAISITLGVSSGGTSAMPAAPAKPETASAAARTIADVKTLEDLQNVETIRVNKRWAVRLGLSEGGKDAGPWKLLYCLADVPPQKNTDPLLPSPESEVSGEMGPLGPVMFTVDDPQVLQKSLQPAMGEVMTENGLVYCAAIPTAWKGTYRIRVWTWDKRLLAERVLSVDEPAPNYWQDFVGSEVYPPTIRPGPYGLPGPSAAYPSYEREVIWSLPRGEAQPLKGQATALPGQIPAGNGCTWKKRWARRSPRSGSSQFAQALDRRRPPSD